MASIWDRWMSAWLLHFGASPLRVLRTDEPSLVSYRHVVGCCRSPGNSASHVTRSIGECRMPLWSALVVSLSMVEAARLVA
jgi:hypothetical protein